MASCCATSATGEPGSCPVCGERGMPVPRQTLERLLKPEKRTEIIDEPYYFCGAPECDIVYFADVPLQYFANEDLIVPVESKVRETYARSVPAAS